MLMLMKFELGNISPIVYVLGLILVVAAIIIPVYLVKKAKEKKKAGYTENQRGKGL